MVLIQKFGSFKTFRLIVLPRGHMLGSKSSLENRGKEKSFRAKDHYRNQQIVVVVWPKRSRRLINVQIYDISKLIRSVAILYKMF